MICRTECRGVHAEFICRNGQYTWLPRTWGCHAFQRKPPKDLGQTECHVLNCRQLHRRGFHHCELASFRAWALQAHPNQWFTVWYSDADLNGRTPLGIIEHRQMIHCLCNQPFMTPEKHRQHDWREIVPAPLTYLEGFSPLEPNYHEPERVQRRRREHRSVTPRFDRHPTSRPTSFGPQQFLQQPHSQAASSQQHTPRFQRTGTTEIHRIHSSIHAPPAPAPFQPTPVPTAHAFLQNQTPQPIQHQLHQPINPPAQSYNMPAPGSLEPTRRR